MKLSRLSPPKSCRVLSRGWTQAFTVTEMLVSVFIFVFMVVAILYAMLAGLRYDELVCSKLGASEKSRMSFDLLTGEIRSAKVWRIGNGSSSNFTAIPNATLQKGNALQLWSNSADTNAYVRYFFDTNLCQLCRKTNGATTYQVLARNLTNVTGASMSFHGEDYKGADVSDWQYKYVIATTMEFCEYQYPMTRVGPGYYYNYYMIQFKTSSHCPN